MTTLQIKCRTLTPLWTGGVDQTCDRLHETGLIGSLRWWYEALVRGLGGYACDPTSDQRCEYDPKKPEPPEKQLCAACYLFGCTGWARRFRLQLSDGQKLFDGQNVLIPSGRVHQSKRGSRAGGWFVFSESRRGEIAFDLVSLRGADLRPIHTILALIGQHASLGPKGASGYGVIQPKNVVSDLGWVQRFGNQTPTRNNPLPDFRDFFFARFQFQQPSNNSNWWQQIDGIRQAVEGKLDDDSSPPRPLRSARRELEQMYAQGILPIAPAIRNWLRHTWKHKLNPNQEQYVFGDARSAIGSKVLVSYAYHRDDNQWEFRIWGWLPCAGKLAKRDAFLNSIKTQLQNSTIWNSVFGTSGIVPMMVAWYEQNCSQTDGRGYLQQLLGGTP